MLRHRHSSGAVAAVLLALSAWVGATSVSVSAAPIIASYDPNRHNRFLSGWPPPDQTTPVTQNPGLLAGVPYGPPDLSGVGWSGNGPYTSATLISPRYFVTAAHYPAGSTVSFINRDGFLRTYNVASYHNTRYRFDYNDGNGLQLRTSDLLIGRLSAPIPTSDNISSYAVYRPQPFVGAATGTPLGASPTSVLAAYAGLEAVVVQQAAAGIGQTLGRQTVLGLTGWTFNPLIPGTGTAGALYNYTSTTGTYPAPFLPSQVGGDWAHLQGGDSGGATFAVVNNQLTLFGVHGGVGTVDLVNGGGTVVGNVQVFVDSLLPYYVDQINAIMAANGDPDQVTLFVTPVPEPSAALLPAAVLAVIALWVRPRKAAA